MLGRLYTRSYRIGSGKYIESRRSGLNFIPAPLNYRCMVDYNTCKSAQIGSDHVGYGLNRYIL